MEKIKSINGFRITRFVIVGMANTAVNFALLNFAFYGLHQTKIISSLIATSCTVLFSFILNRNYVFADKRRPTKQLVLFALVSLGGVLLIQNTIYALGILALNNREVSIINIIHAVTGLTLTRSFIDVNLSNIIASLCVMVWNYNGYRLFVFNYKQPINVITEIETA